MLSAFSAANSRSLLPLSSRGYACRRSTLHGFVPISLRTPINHSVKAAAAAADGRDSLDHLQRANKLRQYQVPLQRSALKRGVAPSAPLGMWDRFPTARTVQQMLETMGRTMEGKNVLSGEALRN